MLIYNLVIKNILRSPTRSLFTFVGTFASALLFSIGLAWLNGVYDNLISSTISTGGHIRVLSKNYYAKEMTFPIEEHLPQVDVISNSILDSNDTQKTNLQLFPIIKQRVLLSTPKNKETSQMSLAIASSKDYQSQLFTQSRCQSTLSNRSGVTVGSKIAKQLQVHVYDELVVMGRTVDGSFSPQKLPIHKIIHCDNYIINSLIFFDYETGLYMIDAEQAATEIVVFDEGDSVDILEMEQRLKELDLSDHYSGEPIEIILEPWYKRQPLAEILPLSILMNGIFALLLTLMVVISIMNPTIMMVWERKGEFLLLRAIGFSKRQIMWLLFLENFILTTLSLLLSVFVGYFWITTQSVGIDVSNSVTGLPQNLPFSTMINPIWNTTQIPLLVFSFGYLASVLGTIIPLYRLLSIIEHPYEILRSTEK